MLSLQMRNAPSPWSDLTWVPVALGSTPPVPVPPPPPLAVMSPQRPWGTREGAGTLRDGAADVVLIFQVVGAVSLGGDGAAHETWGARAGAS